MTLAVDSKLRPMYEKVPIFVDYLLYVFNVTNKDEFIQGRELSTFSSNLITIFIIFFCHYYYLQKRNQSCKRLDRIFLSKISL